MLMQMLSRAPALGSEVEGEGSYCDTVAVIQPGSELPALQREDKELKEIMKVIWETKRYTVSYSATTDGQKCEVT